MFTAKLKVVCAALLLLAGLGVGVSAVWQSVPAAEPPMAGATTPAPNPRKDAPADPPKKPVHPINKSLEGLAKHYALADGEVLKSFRAPFPEERKTFFRVNKPLVTEETMAELVKWGLDKTEFDGNLDLIWKDGRLEFGSVIFAQLGNPPQGKTLEGLLGSLAGIASADVEGDRELRWKTLIGGDFVVRDGADAAKVVARLEEILNKEFKVPVKLTLTEADRKVYVLSGKYKFTAAAPNLENHYVVLYAKDPPEAALPLPSPAPERRDVHTFPEFVQRLGCFVDRRVLLGKAERLPAEVSWNETYWEFSTPESSWEAEHALGPVLKHVTEQTGLTVSEEIRRVRVLVVERKK